MVTIFLQVCSSLKTHRKRLCSATDALSWLAFVRCQNSKDPITRNYSWSGWSNVTGRNTFRLFYLRFVVDQAVSGGITPADPRDKADTVISSKASHALHTAQLWLAYWPRWPRCTPYIITQQTQLIDDERVHRFESTESPHTTQRSTVWDIRSSQQGQTHF